MIKKVYWYCPMCNYSTNNEPIGTACIACGHDSAWNKPAHTRPNGNDMWQWQHQANAQIDEILKKQLERSRKSWGNQD